MLLPPSTATDYGYTVYKYTSPKPTATSCPDPNAGARIVPQLAGSMLVTTRVSAPSGAPAVVPRDQDDRGGKCKDCLPVVEGISSACACFFSAGPQQTVTRQQTVAVLTVTVTTTTYALPARTRTLAGMLKRHRFPRSWSSAPAPPDTLLLPQASFNVSQFELPRHLSITLQLLPALFLPSLVLNPSSFSPSLPINSRDLTIPPPIPPITCPSKRPPPTDPYPQPAANPARCPFTAPPATPSAAPAASPRPNSDPAWPHPPTASPPTASTRWTAAPSAPTRSTATRPTLTGPPTSAPSRSASALMVTTLIARRIARISILLSSMAISGRRLMCSG